MITITFYCTIRAARQLLKYYEGLAEPENEKRGKSQTREKALQGLRSWHRQFLIGLETLNLSPRTFNALARGTIVREYAYNIETKETNEIWPTIPAREAFVNGAGNLMSFDMWTRAVTKPSFQRRLSCLRQVGKKTISELIDAIKRKEKELKRAHKSMPLDLPS